jgi:hypothetical protein
MRTEYRMEKGMYRFFQVSQDRAELMFETPRVALLYSKGDGYVLHKHGAPERVAVHYDLFNKVFPGYFIKVESDWDLAELNKAISVKGYMRTIHRQLHGESAAEPEEEILQAPVSEVENEDESEDHAAQ